MFKSFFYLLIVLTSISVEAKNIVFWLSIDGFKPSYLEKSSTPFINNMLKHAVYTKKLHPTFPSITFPSHSSQATGVKVRDHGIPFNTFYDSRTKKIVSYPSDSKFLEAEPIWQTVKKGGLRSAVMDWPLSFKQTGNLKSDYFSDSYKHELSDEERIDHVLDLWQKDFKSGKSLDLVMAYIVGPDSVGHKYGPEDEKVFRAVENVDKLIGKLKAKIREFADLRKGDDYYLLITTDHGMTKVNTAVNFSILSNLSSDTKIKLVFGGNVGHVFLDEIPQSEKKSWVLKLQNEYKKYSFLKVYPKDKLPVEWGYDHIGRVGDLIVVLDPGYAFVNNATKVTVPISETDGPLGMHGYDPKLVSDMQGLVILWRYPEIQKSIEVNGAVGSLQLHPTVAQLLGVKPSSKANAKPILEVLDFK